MKSILDESLRAWLEMGLAEKRNVAFSIRTTEKVKQWVKDVAAEQGMPANKVAHLALMFGLAALVKYWEDIEGAKSEPAP
jgi:hypothetical protein